MSVKFKKSCCLRVGQRFNVTCANIISLNGQALPWVKEMKYFGIHVVSSKLFKCSIHETKRSFYRSANEICGKIGRFAPENVTLQLIQSKCIHSNRLYSKGKLRVRIIIRTRSLPFE